MFSSRLLFLELLTQLSLTIHYEVVLTFLSSKLAGKRRVVREQFLASPLFSRVNSPAISDIRMLQAARHVTS